MPARRAPLSSAPYIRAVNWPHVHLILNHLPVVGAVFSAGVLAYGAAIRAPAAVRAGLWALVATAIFGAATYFTGEPAEHALEDRNLPGVTEEVIEAHQDFARISTVVLVAVGLVALAGLVRFRGQRHAPRGFVVAVFVLSLVAVGTMAWTANLGGRIRHTEIRGDLPVSGEMARRRSAR